MECIDFRDVLRRSDELIYAAMKTLAKMETKNHDVVISQVDTGPLRRRAARQYDTLI
jgi:hypothetical protein